MRKIDKISEEETSKCCYRPAKISKSTRKGTRKLCSKCGKNFIPLVTKEFIKKYTMAEKLQKAGFPQLWVKYESPKMAYIPHLDEIIKACGARFHHLINNIHEWKASGINGEFGKGTTPDEAISNLWLELNKK